MTAEDGASGITAGEWHYTRKTLKAIHEGWTKDSGREKANKEDGWLAAAAGYALDLMDMAGDIPNHPMEFDLVGPTAPDDMAFAITVAAIAFQDEGQDRVRNKLAKMLASYELFTTMNTLLAHGVDCDYRISDSVMMIRATNAEGESVEFQFLAEARLTMIMLLLPKPGEERFAGISLGSLYNKLYMGFVVPLISSEDA